MAGRERVLDTTNRVYVLLGSNIDKEQNLPAAVRILEEACPVVAVSTVYETCPVGLEDQPPFLNAAVLVETPLDAAAFKRRVLATVERKLGRVRTEDKNAPRTIDADIILFNDERLDLDPAHHIPDPELLEFAHVAVPVAELAPDMHHPETGERLADIASRLEQEVVGDKLTCLLRRPDLNLYQVIGKRRLESGNG